MQDTKTLPAARTLPREAPATGRRAPFLEDQHQALRRRPAAASRECPRIAPAAPPPTRRPRSLSQHRPPEYYEQASRPAKEACCGLAPHKAPQYLADPGQPIRRSTIATCLATWQGVRSTST